MRHFLDRAVGALSVLVVITIFNIGAQQEAKASTILYTGETTTATGTIALFLGNLPFTSPGSATFVDGTNDFVSMNFNIGPFFFSSLWTGNCTSSGGTCTTTDSELPIGSVFVPLISVLSNTLTFDGTGNPNGGAIIMDAFSLNFGIPWGDLELDQSGDVFSLIGSELGEVFGTGSFAVPVPAAAWLFGSALGLLGRLQRRTA